MVRESLGIRDDGEQPVSGKFTRKEERGRPGLPAPFVLRWLLTEGAAALVLRLPYIVGYIVSRYKSFVRLMYQMET